MKKYTGLFIIGSLALALLAIAANTNVPTLRPAIQIYFSNAVVQGYQVFAGTTSSYLFVGVTSEATPLVGVSGTTTATIAGARVRNAGLYEATGYNAYQFGNKTIQRSAVYMTNLTMLITNSLLGVYYHPWNDPSLTNIGKAVAMPLTNAPFFLTGVPISNSVSVYGYSTNAIANTTSIKFSLWYSDDPPSSATADACPTNTCVLVQMTGFAGFTNQNVACSVTSNNYPCCSWQGTIGAFITQYATVRYNQVTNTPCYNSSIADNTWYTEAGLAGYFTNSAMFGTYGYASGSPGTKALSVTTCP